MYSQFTLFPRKSKRHCQIYYVRFRDSDTGERLTPTSSGKTNKSAATQWAIDQLRKGDITQKSKLSFREFTKNWFVWGKCPYISLMLSKGHSFSHSHADGRRRTLINHLLPYFLGMKLSAIDVNTIESFLANLGKKNYSPSTVNNAYYTLSIVLSEALRQGYIQSNPILKIKRIAPRAVEKGTIPLDLARKLFLADSINSHNIIRSFSNKQEMNRQLPKGTKFPPFFYYCSILIPLFVELCIMNSYTSQKHN